MVFTKPLVVSPAVISAASAIASVTVVDMSFAMDSALVSVAELEVAPSPFILALTTVPWSSTTDTDVVCSAIVTVYSTVPSELSRRWIASLSRVLERLTTSKSLKLAY